MPLTGPLRLQRSSGGLKDPLVNRFQPAWSGIPGIAGGWKQPPVGTYGTLDRSPAD
jgi:hypothetical protein